MSESPTRARPRPGWKQWLPWAALAVVLAGALTVGAGAGAGAGHHVATTDERVKRIASEVRCPTCAGLSAAESDAKAAGAVRDEIRRRVEAHQSDGTIKGYLTYTYGPDILLRPEGRGVSALVWALPVVAVVCAVAGLVVAFRRWRRWLS